GLGRPGGDLLVRAVPGDGGRPGQQAVFGLVPGHDAVAWGEPGPIRTRARGEPGPARPVLGRAQVDAAWGEPGPASPVRGRARVEVEEDHAVAARDQMVPDPGRDERRPRPWLGAGRAPYGERRVHADGHARHRAGLRAQPGR